ncbi:MAG: [Fe-S]-binding protein, partial [Candidatus Latescibacterota bacterium]
MDGEPLPDEIPPARGGLTRRSFLRAAGFSAAGALVTSCSRAPVEKAIPLLVKPEEITPGTSLYYASTCLACPAACGLLMECRDGRPIKLEGNPDHPLSRGALCAVGQASLLGLYDSRRLRSPVASGAPATWDEVDRIVAEELERVARSGGAVRLLTGTFTSPTLDGVIARFLARFADARHVVYDALSCSAVLDAHQRTHGSRLLPHYRFERAEVIASFDADFLGTWISPVEFAAAWRAGRQLDGEAPRMSYHVQLEGRMSLTGTKADRRVRLHPDDLPQAVSHLVAALARRAGTPFAGVETEAPLAAELDELAARLWHARGRSLVVCGSQDVRVQVLANLANHLLGNYGTTLVLNRPSYQRRGNDGDLAALLAEVEAGKVAALFVAGCNPVAELPGGGALAAALARVPLLVDLAHTLDETARLARLVCPDHHPLESWWDAEPVAGVLSLAQPGISPQSGTRALLHSLATWAGAPAPAYDLIRSYWRQEVHPRTGTSDDFEAFWERAVHDGVVEVPRPEGVPGPFDLAALRPLAPAPHRGASLVLHAQVGMLDGRHAENPWLQELPDPVTKVAWDNVVCLSPAAAAELGVAEGDLVRISAEGAALLELPAYVQPGQHDQVVAVALGYGRDGSRRFADVGPRWLEGEPSVGEDGRVGQNAAGLLRLAEGALRYERSG